MTDGVAETSSHSATTSHNRLIRVAGSLAPDSLSHRLNPPLSSLLSVIISPDAAARGIFLSLSYCSGDTGFYIQRFQFRFRQKLKVPSCVQLQPFGRGDGLRAEPRLTSEWSWASAKTNHGSLVFVLSC